MAAEQLPSRVTTKLELQQRVPDTHSAANWEHLWHRADYVDTVDVTQLTAAVTLEHAGVLRAAAHGRGDYEYRVALITVETTGWVLA